MLPAAGTSALGCDRSCTGIKRHPVGYSAEKASALGVADAVSASNIQVAAVITTSVASVFSFGASWFFESTLEATKISTLRRR